MITRRTSVVREDDDAAPGSVQPLRGVHNIERFSWDNLRLFLDVAEAGSFRAAAITSGVSLNTIRTKIERLEKQIGGPLVRRSVEGVVLTQGGHELLSIAREMRTVGRTAERVQRGEACPRTAPVRITATEGLGTLWLIPRLAEFLGGNPEIGVNINCAANAPDVLFRDVDIAVLLVPPKSPGVVVHRLATLHWMPFASETYLRTFGALTSIADVPDHKLVWGDADRLSSELLSVFVDPKIIERITAVKTNTSSAHLWAVANGAGIGFLPTYARALSRNMRPQDIGLHVRRDVYLVHHSDAVHSPEVCKTIDWLKQSFDATEFPWFAEEFIHPDDFEARLDESVPDDLFEALVPPQAVRS